MRQFTTAVVLILMGTIASAQSEQAYSDAQIDAAIEIGYDDDLDQIMHTCNASVGGLWNKLGEAISNAEGQPLREWRIHGQPPLARIAQEADFARGVVGRLHHWFYRSNRVLMQRLASSAIVASSRRASSATFTFSSAG